MKKCFLFLFAFFLATSSYFAQTAPTDEEMHYWKILSKVRHKTVFDKATGEMYYEPIFNKSIEALEGKKIVINGYIIPADMAKGKMTLSAFPFSSCFFCGQAGPESVMEIEAKGPIIYRMDKLIELQGTLKINRTDPFRLMYILQNAEHAD